MRKSKKIGIFGILLILVNIIFFFAFQENIIPFLINISVAIYLCSFLFKK
ncbi:membrane protein [gut metagenome]|uniref:Membrane protein n=1 Tax=gut metagenome TaxID=749906 RepID=J9GH31_9ZZZZ